MMDLLIILNLKKNAYVSAHCGNTFLPHEKINVLVILDVFIIL